MRILTDKINAHIPKEFFYSGVSCSDNKNILFFTSGLNLIPKG